MNAADESASIEVSTPGTREPDPEPLRRQIGMLCLQYAVLENESACCAAPVSSRWAHTTSVVDLATPLYRPRRLGRLSTHRP
ncbi:MAG: hypothetical protein ACLU37_07150 [Collinsella sp.]